MQSNRKSAFVATEARARPKPPRPPSTDWQTGPSLKYHDYI